MNKQKVCDEGRKVFFFQVFVLKFERAPASVPSLIYLVIPSASGPRSAPRDLHDLFLFKLSTTVVKSLKRRSPSRSSTATQSSLDRVEKFQRVFTPVVVKASTLPLLGEAPPLAHAAVRFSG